MLNPIHYKVLQVLQGTTSTTGTTVHRQKKSLN